jgi:antitoxin component YwqK of YwqJK toxin-antitoxin module
MFTGTTSFCENTKVYSTEEIYFDNGFAYGKESNTYINGLVKSYYDESGNLESEVSFKDGKLKGITKGY